MLERALPARLVAEDHAILQVYCCQRHRPCENLEINLYKSSESGNTQEKLHCYVLCIRTRAPSWFGQARCALIPFSFRRTGPPFLAKPPRSATRPRLFLLLPNTN